MFGQYNDPAKHRDAAIEERVFESPAPPQALDLTSEGQADESEAEAVETEELGDERIADQLGPEDSVPNVASDWLVEMTPEVDAGFAQLARERISRNPLRHYLLLPCKRAFTVWFDTHSQFYPFEGELLPLARLDREMNQHIWLPVFAALTLVYSLLGVAGAWFLWHSRVFQARYWILLAAAMIFLRIGYVATLENPEPRYVVEVFPFLCILGSIAATRITARRSSSILSSPV